jgi:hypothetical protein
MEDA